MATWLRLMKAAAFGCKKATAEPTFVAGIFEWPEATGSGRICCEYSNMLPPPVVGPTAVDRTREFKPFCLYVKFERELKRKSPLD